MSHLSFYATEHGEPDPDRLADVIPHPHDREAYSVFAELMGWRAEWDDLGTGRDIPGPGQVPFVAAFQRVRELMGREPAGRWAEDSFTAGLVDHWGDWVAGRAKRKAAAKGRRRR